MAGTHHLNECKVLPFASVCLPAKFSRAPFGKESD